jgi:hypothetical protein
MVDTPIENRYPWLKMADVKPDLPENPTERDFAKAYATIVMVYQAQREQIYKIMKDHQDERMEILSILRTISTHQTQASPMPTWAKIHSGVMLVQAVAIGWLIYVTIIHQQLLERLAALHR